MVWVDSIVSEEIQNVENVDQLCVKNKKKKGKRWIKISITIIVVSNIIGAAYLLGFIPIGLTIKEPIGNVETIDVDQVMKDFPGLADMPNLDKIQYKAFGTDAAVDDVNQDYEQKLAMEGYNLEYSETVEIDGVSFEVNGYLKGLTAVAILTTDETIGDYNFNSVVFYATGNALDFQEILNWYQSL